jgi:hypothetical protein
MKTLEDGRTSHGHGSAESILWQWLFYQTQSICSKHPYQNFNDILHRERKANPKAHMETQKVQISKEILSQKNNVGRWYHNTWLQNMPQKHRIKIALYWHINRHTDKQTRIVDHDTNSCNYSHTLFNKGAKNWPGRKDSFFNKWCWEN